jgi:hypothetical protein
LSTKRTPPRSSPSGVTPASGLDSGLRRNDVVGGLGLGRSRCLTPAPVLRRHGRAVHPATRRYLTKCRCPAAQLPAPKHLQIYGPVLPPHRGEGEPYEPRAPACASYRSFTSHEGQLLAQSGRDAPPTAVSASIPKVLIIGNARSRAPWSTCTARRASWQTVPLTRSGSPDAKSEDRTDLGG